MDFISSFGNTGIPLDTIECDVEFFLYPSIKSINLLGAMTESFMIDIIEQHKIVVCQINN